jgi:hypothetical protein
LLITVHKIGAETPDKAPSFQFLGSVSGGSSTNGTTLCERSNAHRASSILEAASEPVKTQKHNLFDRFKGW